MTELTPPEKKTEFFGFIRSLEELPLSWAVCFGLISSFVNQRVAILSVGVFLLAGILFRSECNS